MLSEKMQTALNDHVNKELWSAYLYLSMANYFETLSLSGFVNWFKVQYQEETAHATKIIDYINERGGRVKLKAIETVRIDWENPLDAFQDTLNHEQIVTGLINKLVDIAKEESDHATFNFLQWFVAEQVEEEANVDEVLQQLKFGEGNKHVVLLLDRELKQRQFIDPNQQGA